MNYLPKSIIKDVELDSLKLAPTHFVEKALKERRSGEIYFYNLFFPF